MLEPHVAGRNIAASIAAEPAKVSRPPADFAHRHPHQQPHQAGRIIRRELTARGASQETREHRLADVFAIELPAQRGIGQAGANRDANRPAIHAQQFLGGVGIASAQSGQQHRQRIGSSHDGAHGCASSFLPHDNTAPRNQPQHRCGTILTWKDSPDGRMMALSVTPQQILLADPNDGHELARLTMPPMTSAWPAAFSHDGANFAVMTKQGAVYIWDLRRIRERLATMGLDWDAPPFPTESPPPAPRLVHVQVIGEVSEPTKDDQ